MGYKYIFGPVASRRLGVSLGIDLLPYKTCTLDCIYCECGKTTDLRIERENFVDYNDVLKEIDEFLKNNDFPDAITFSGSGEPTLYKDFGILASKIKEKYKNIKICLLTNTTLFNLKEVREGAKVFDIVLPSLDAVLEDEFNKINKPHKEIKLENIINGLKEFKKEYKGEIWLEIFFAKGVNDSKMHVDKLYKVVKEIFPYKVQLNSLDRPPAYEGVESVSKEFLENIVRNWKDLNVEIISRYKTRESISDYSRNLEELILNALKIRPYTFEDLQTIFNKDKTTLNKYIDLLESEKKIKAVIIENKIFYKLNESN